MPNLVTLRLFNPGESGPGRLTLHTESVRAWVYQKLARDIFPCDRGPWDVRGKDIALLTREGAQIGTVMNLDMSKADIGDQGILLVQAQICQWFVTAIGNHPPALLYLSANPTPGGAPVIVGPSDPR